MTRRKVTKTKGFLSALAVALLVWLGSGLAGAQSTTGSIYGVVNDGTGALLPGTKITVRNVQTNAEQTTTSNSSGAYTFTTLLPGDYTVTAQVAGFATQTQRGVRLDANQNVDVKFAMQTGAVTEDITVDAATTLVDTRESQIAQTIDQKRIADLPSLNRNVYELLTITPGVTNYTADTQTGSRAGTQVSINGSGQNNTAYYLDGAYDTNTWKFGGNLMPNPDSLQEFRIITSNFDAEFGRSSGGVVNAITRSGSNQFHGLVYDYLRNNILNGKSYFASVVQPLRQNQFGANFGGHVPWMKDKMFFFTSYEGLRVRTPTPVTSASLLTPTQAERKGDFSLTPKANTIVLPATNGNGVTVQCGTAAAPKICAAALDPVAQNLLAFVPVGSSDPSNYGHPDQQSANANINNDQGLARVDLRLNEKHQVAFSYFESRGISNTPTVSGNQIVSYAGMQNYEGQYNAILNHTWTISPNKVNTFSAYYSLNHYIIQNIYGDQHLLASLGSQAAQGGNYNAQPYFKVNGYWQMGTSNAGPNNLPSSTLGATDAFVWSLGKHDLKLGGSFMWDRFTSTGGASSNGLFTFAATTAPYTTQSNNALVNFLLGRASTLTQNTGVFFRSHSADPSVFAQDDWKITNQLTLNLGVRWEYFPMYTGQNNTATFVPGQQSTRFPSAPLGLVFSGDKGIPDGIQKTPWNTFSPRLGFAYDVFGDGRTALRGAYGMFYAAIDQVAVSNNLVQQPYSRSVTVSVTKNLVTPFAPAADPFPYTPDPSNAQFLAGANIFALQPGFHNIPSVQEFSLGVQQQFGAKWSSQINYVGNVGRHGTITRDEDGPIYNPTCTTATCNSTVQKNARRPFNPAAGPYTYAAISEVLPSTNTSYHSLQATLTRRFDKHFSIIANYVWSKAMEYGAVVDNFNLRSSYGPAGINMPNKFTISYIYVTPDVRFLGLAGKEVLSGWQVNGITTLRSGQPFTVTSGVDTNFDGTNNDRPNLVGNPYLPSGRGRLATIGSYLNTAAFAPVQPGTPTGQGNVSYDSLLSPKGGNTDLSAFKTFDIYKEANLQFRAEAFNVLNQVIFYAPSSSTANANFGQISSSSGARVLQFALRLSF